MNVNTEMLRLRRFLIFSHIWCGLPLLVGALWQGLLVLGAPVPYLPSNPWLIPLWGRFPFFWILTILPRAAFGVWLLLLAYWVYRGVGRLRMALLLTQVLILLHGALFLETGFRMLAWQRIHLHRIELSDPLTLLPFLYGGPMVIFALYSIVMVLKLIPKASDPDK